MALGFLFQLLTLVRTCAPDVAPETMLAIVAVESEGNPYAIGVVGARLKVPPTNAEEAALAAKLLEGMGKSFSVGLAQVNRRNLPWLGLTYEQAFDPCENLRAASKILVACYQSAKKQAPLAEEQKALSDALSCYGFGNFTRGYDRKDGKPSYIEKVRAAARPLPPYTVPSLVFSLHLPPGPAPVPLQEEVKKEASISNPPREEAPLLVPSSTCRGAVLGAPCSAPVRKQEEPPSSVF